MDRDFDDYEPWDPPEWPKDSWSIPDELAAMRRAVDFAGIFAGVAVLVLFFTALWVWSVVA